MAEDSNSLRAALDSIMGISSAATEAPSGGLEEGLAAPPKQASDVNLVTTANLSNPEYTPPPSPFEAELAAVQAQNADLSAQLSASMAARPQASAYTPTAYTPSSYTPPSPVQFNTLSYKAPAPKAAAPAPAPVPYGQGNQTYIYQSPYTAASQPQYGYEHFYNSNPYYK